MKPLLIVAVSLGALALTPVPAAAARGDSVTAAGSDCLHVPPGETFCDRTFLFDFQVASGPAGENPVGTVSWYDAGPTPGASSAANSIDATCLSVRGHVATIGVAGSWERFGVEGLVAP